MKYFSNFVSRIRNVIDMKIEKHIEGLRCGSYNDFKVIYNRYAGNLYGFVFGLTRSHELSKDIVQDTFIKIWTNRESIDPTQSFKSYLFKISHNLIIDEFRKRLNNPIFESYLDYSDNLPISNPFSVEQKLDYDLFVERLNKAKEKLTSRQKEIFELSKEMGMTSPQISEKLNISEQTIYNQLSAAIRILRKEVGSAFLLFTIFFE